MAPPTFAPFDPSTEVWDAYMERFECFLEANDFTDLSGGKKRAHFLNSCGPEVFATARALFAPTPVHTVAWDVLRLKLKDHYSPTPSRIARRFQLRQVLQEEGESINHYVARLRTAALDCEYHDLDDALVEQLVCGVKDIRLQRRLLAKKNLNLPTAIEEAQAAEMSDKSTADIRKFYPSRGLSSTTVNLQDIASDESTDEEADISRLHASKPRPKDKRWPFRPQPSLCFSCGEQHPRATCRFRSATCRRCGKLGHIARACRSLPKPAALPKSRRPKKEECFSISRDCRITEVTSLSRLPSNNKLSLTVLVEGASCPMEVDTGSAKSIVSWGVLKQLIPTIQKRHLKPCPVRLRDYQGNFIPILGQDSFLIETEGFVGHLPLIVVKGFLPSLLGMDWFQALGLQIAGIHSTHVDSFGGLFNEFSDIFDGGLGQYVGSPISLNLDPQVAPIRLKPRRVPFALRPKVDAELDKLLAQGVLEPTDHSKWETPIVVPIKPDGSIRICGDFKCTLNKALAANPYPVPVVQHLLHSLGPGSIFAKLDLAQAYQQLPVDDASAEAQTIVTHRGAFKCRRLQFGVNVAPGLFQNLMERLLQGLPGVVPYFDDVLVSASCRGELIERVRAVLLRFRESGLKLNKNKCKIGVSQIEFLGYLVDGKGIRPTPSKVAAIKHAPLPTCRAELQSFLGLLNFYNVFLPHKATVAEPLHRLLSKATPWVWTTVHDRAFRAVKDLLSSSAVLVQYSSDLPLTLTADASPFGIGAVLSHRFPNGLEAPIAFYSRTLSSAERNYSQLDREALAAVAAIKRFHEYLYGRPFELVTDHKPLLGLLDGCRQTPLVMSPRMSRWSVFLAAYNYSLVYRPGKLIPHADALSRSPLPAPVLDPSPALPVLLVDELSLPLTSTDIAAHSLRDPILSQVLHWVSKGWPLGQVPTTFAPYRTRQNELSVHLGCLLWGHRVVVPPFLQPEVLRCLHTGHPGIVRMKELGRSYVWWPSFDHDVSAWVSGCQPCQLSRPAPPSPPPRDWETPRGPWSRLHLDFAGPFRGRHFLIVVDALSKWVELELMPSTTAEATVRVLRRLFTTHGIPDVIVTDNGPQFVSATFQSFLASLGTRHAQIAPYRPSGNGLAERAVRSAKDALARFTSGSWQDKIDAYLFTQHVTPCPLTHRSPAEVLMGRRLRTVMDRLHPTYAPEGYQGVSVGLRAFKEGDLVFARNYGGEPRWLPGRVIAVTGPCSYRIQLTDGRSWRRHVDQLRGRQDTISVAGDGRDPGVVPQDATPPRYIPVAVTLPPTPRGPSLAQDLPVLPDVPIGHDGSPATPAPDTGPPPSAAGAAPALRRSSRLRRRPEYLKDYVCSSQG